MVNTFLICSDYYQSAVTLDKKRLPNQRREALQILNNIIKWRELGILLGSPLPDDPYQLVAWSKQIRQTYKQSNYILIWKNQLLHKSDSIKADYKPVFTVCHKSLWDTNQEMSGYYYNSRIKKMYKKTPLEPNDMYLGHNGKTGWGYMSHPAVYMWLQYPDSLRQYIDAHIQATIEMGVKNEMPRFNSGAKIIEQPPWTYDDMFHLRHKSNLLTKELDRNENPCYVEQEIYNVETGLKYYWPYTLSISKAASESGECDAERRYNN